MKPARIMAVNTGPGWQEILFFWRATSQWYWRRQIANATARVEPLTRQQAREYYTAMVTEGAATRRSIGRVGAEAIVRDVSRVYNVNPSGRAGIGWAICR